MDITGTVKLINQEVKISDKFTKREFVVTENSSQYPQHITFQLSNDRVDIIDKVKVGDELQVFFNLRGRCWTNPKGEDKYFNTLEAWKVVVVNKLSDLDQESYPNQDDEIIMREMPEGFKPSGNSDLPF